MKLLTKEIKQALPAMGATEGQGSDAIAVVKYFDPTGSATWYGIEFDGDDQFFGWAELLPGCGEYGYFSLRELQSVRGPLGLGIERDLYFTPKPIGEVLG